MPAKVFSAAVIGLNCQPIEVEVDMTVGLHCFHIVGLPDMAVNESRERVSSAVKNSGCLSPQHSRRRVIVNLAPADLKKEGPAYDLPVALAFLIASNQIAIKHENLQDKIFAGELSLEGKLRPINGVLCMALMTAEKGFKTLFIPKENVNEAALVKNIEIIGLESLTDLIDHLENKKIIEPHPAIDLEQVYQKIKYPFDMAYIKGQEHAKRALEIVAAGGHNILMQGPPGTGKTLLAQTIPSILPPLSLNEALEVTKIFSCAGRLPRGQAIINQRPFRSPHHTASAVALVGGGTNIKPGEITLAHRGVLFLDEFPEFSRGVLEALRQPLENGVITVSRASGTLDFPAKFILVGAMNPCPCGRANDPELQCTCPPSQVSKYRRRISEPLLDRIDLHVEVPRIKYDKLTSEKVAEESETIKQRIQKAREIQKKRFIDETLKNSDTILTNSEMNLEQIKRCCQLDLPAQDILKNAVERLHLSTRTFHRIIKLARTIADLANEEKIKPRHIAEAIQYRPKSAFPA